MTRRTRPNANVVLDLMRDGDVGHDPFGTAMSWAFAVAEVLHDADPNMVPAELGYSPSIAGAEVPNGSGEPEPYRITLVDVPYETAEVWCYLHNVGPDDPAASDADSLPYWEDPTFADRAETLRFAGRCLHRYIDWCKAAGRDY